MFGDCQVLSSMGGGNGVPQDSFYPSSIQNPNNNNNNNNFNFISNLPFSIFPPLIPKEENVMSSMNNNNNKSKEEMMESGSGSEQIEGLSGNEQDSEQQLLLQQQQQQQQLKKKRYHRHTARQIQEMESLFKECPHPDDKQRMKLSQDLGLKPRQVKFWFQNRRTQMKAQQDRQDNVILRAENENLKTENYRLQTALRNIMCPNCGGPAMLADMAFDEQQLRLENARLKEEFERVCLMVTQYNGRGPMQAVGSTSSLLAPSLDLDMSIFPRKFDDHQEPLGSCSDMVPPFINPNETSSFGGGGGGGGVLILDEEEKSLAMELAISSVEVLIKMCQMGEPLWIRTNELAGTGKELLNVQEYSRMFSWPSAAAADGDHHHHHHHHLKQQNQGDMFLTEATRHSSVIIMNSITLVDAFLDAGKWMELFPSIVSRAKTLQVVNSGISGHASGSLQLMYAEIQVPSPLVPTREANFLRYCQQNVEEGIWAIVDFPLDSFHNNMTYNNPPTFPYSKKKPSGCIIQDMPNGYSRVTWVEHIEMEENHVHQIFSDFVSSGMAFGAQRWLAVLQRQCERIASLMARNISDLGVIPSPEARKNLMKLSQRMIRTFCINISSCCGQSWTALSDSVDDTIRITPRKVIEPAAGEPNGLVLSAVSTTWLPFTHYQVFDFLRDERRRAQLDVLSNGNSLQEVAHIANGSHPGNCISLLRINVASNSSQRVELMLQESCIDDSGSLVVYAIVDVEAIQLAMSGEDPSCIPLLPLGFVIHPHHHDSTSNITTTTTTDQLINNNNENTPSSSSGGGGGGGGCLLTVGLQVLTSTIPTAKLNLSSVTAINHNLCNTVQQINAALTNNIGISNHNISSAAADHNGSSIVVSCTAAAAADTPGGGAPTTDPHHHHHHHLHQPDQDSTNS